ncbi:hypothetical protein BS78_K176800 [Paspalum vaginatum]|uniref:Disease resistance protein At4g27190-like leucine-rich repeats domain-containing protein n=1 Tax=Paspalum vaginatum TaxID=158149 RepID=A0A9W8CEY0_9POAL|nr:hypothetical protein BS78_K176800 [Paspalum vaginatum]
MKIARLIARDVAGAREEIFYLIQRNPNYNTIYFDGWDGLGATAVLRSIPQALLSMKSPPPGLCFGRIIYIDCSTWKSKRGMQRKIAHELKLDRKTMAMFEERDEEDDFNGVDHGSRDVIREVSAMILQTLIQTRFMLILLNGSKDEVAPSEFGIPEYHCTIIWTFSRGFVTMHKLSRVYFERLGEILRRTDMFICTLEKPTDLSDSQLNALFHEEAASIVSRCPFMRDITLTMFIDCWRYGFFLRRSSHSTIGLDWEAKAPNFWICDGIIQEGSRAREISYALDSEISYEGDASLLDGVFAMVIQHLETSHLVVEDKDDSSVDKYGERPYRWISITSKSKIVQANIQTMLAEASSIFIAFDRTINAPRLPEDLFKLSSNLGILILSGCAFNFVSPPFIHCHTLRFLGLSSCTHQNGTFKVEEGDYVTKWTCLHNMWVLDLRYTDWGEVLSEEKICLMDNLIELNIEGVRCWHYTSQLQKRLPYLQRLRIIKPARQEETLIDINNSFVDKKQLEILDWSGNSKMENLPASLSEASKLLVLVLDGCDALENVMLTNSSLRLFSFDGYGPTSHWTSTGNLPPMSSRPKSPPTVENRCVKACKISLEGCTFLEDLFLRGLPNLEELDLSGCAVKVIDFGAMVVDVPKLKRLFLLGCERLRAIKWGSIEKQLELIHIDTRPRIRTGRVLGCAQPPSLGAQQKTFHLQMHAVIVDARLSRSLWAPIDHAGYNGCYNIKFTSSTSCSDGVVQPKAKEGKEMIVGSSDQRQYDAANAGLYGDVFTNIGDGATPMQAFPQGPVRQLDRHIEIGDGSHHVQSEMETDTYIGNFAPLMWYYTQSLHVHDVSNYSNTMPSTYSESLVWCRVERCPNLHAVFPPGSQEHNGKLETVWASDLLMARCVWSKGAVRRLYTRFHGLRHLHLRRCPSLQFALAMGSGSSFPSLETLHIIHCGGLRHIFVPGNEKHQHPSVEFPKLTTIHLHDVPALQEICEAAVMVAAPALETIKIRGCWGLRRLPALKGREPGTRRPAVEIEKDVWDALEWDGVDAGHHPSLYEAPLHSRHYKRRMLRVTVLR